MNDGVDGRLTGLARVTVPASLLLSFVANDGEELVTMARTIPRVLERVSTRLPLPGFVRRGAIAQDHVNVSIAVMGALCVAATVDGCRTAGRGWLYQNVQLAFGVHGFAHLAASAATGGYTSGVATSPTIVIPQWIWAKRALRRADVSDRSHPGQAALLVLCWLGMAHVLAHVLTLRPDQIPDHVPPSAATSSDAVRAASSSR